MKKKPSRKCPCCGQTGKPNTREGMRYHCAEYSEYLKKTVQEMLAKAGF